MGRARSRPNITHRRGPSKNNSAKMLGVRYEFESSYTTFLTSYCYITGVHGTRAAHWVMLCSLRNHLGLRYYCVKVKLNDTESCFNFRWFLKWMKMGVDLIAYSQIIVIVIIITTCWVILQFMILVSNLYECTYSFRSTKPVTPWLLTSKRDSSLMSSYSSSKWEEVQ